MIFNYFNKIQKLFSNNNFTKIFKNIIWLSSDKIIRMGVGLIVSVWIARYLGPNNFGIWNYAIAFVALFSVVSTLGLEEIAIRELLKMPDKQNELLGTAFLMKLTGSIILVLLTTGAIIIIKPGDKLMFFMVMIISVGYIFQTFNVLDFYNQAYVKSKFTVISTNIAFLTTSIVKIILLIFKANLILFALAGVLEILLSSLFLIITFLLNKQRILTWKFDSGIFKLYLYNCWPLIISTMAIVFYIKIDQIMIGQMLGVGEVGLYSAAVRISEIWYFIPMAIASSVFPSVIQIKKNNPALYEKRLLKFYSIMVYIGILAAVFFSLTSSFLINILFGDDYIKSAPVLSIHIWAGVFVCFGVARSKWLITENLQKLSIWYILAGAVVNVILNYFLINLHGIMGAAVATIISQFTAALLAPLMFKETRKTFFMFLKSLLFWRIFK